MSNLSIFNPPPPGDLDRLSKRLVGSDCLTHYQRFCLRVAELSLDLPPAGWHVREKRAGLLLRHQDRLDQWSVQCWLLEAARSDGLAAMVMLDAMNFFCDCLRIVADPDDHDLFDSRFKREFTQRIQGLSFVFRVPSGWELSLFQDRYDEGNYGVGYIARCHLSQSTTHEDWGYGELLGRGNAQSFDVGYFGVPCEIAAQFNRMPIDVDDERWAKASVTATIPYQWIIQTRNRNEADRRLYLHTIPSEQEILNVAINAIEAVEKRIAEIEARMTEGGKVSCATNTEDTE